MKTRESPLEKGMFYKDNSDFTKYILYKFIYPFVNAVGLNRPFNLFRHKYGFYAENSNGLCQWCGKNHRITPISAYKEKTPEEIFKGLSL